MLWMMAAGGGGIRAITPKGDTIDYPLLCPSGTPCDTLPKRRRRAAFGEWFSEGLGIRRDTTPPNLPRLSNCKWKVGKATTFILDTFRVGNTAVPAGGVIKIILDSTQHYGSERLRFYVRTKRAFIMDMWVWNKRRGQLMRGTWRFDPDPKGKARLIERDYRRGLRPGMYVPPTAPVPPDFENGKLIITIFVPGKYRGEDVRTKLEVSEICLE
ncbi:MAG: hypothetical protein GXO29_05735 [Thermotogae bacterium]|nr:hypothetical protein [Thermotogota bacterium]